MGHEWENNNGGSSGLWVVIMAADCVASTLTQIDLSHLLLKK